MSMGNVPSALVRMAHCHQSCSFSAKYATAMKIVGRSIRQVKVTSLPAGSAVWLEANWDLLILTRADTSIERLKFLHQFLNNSYDEADPVHWCVFGCCKTTAEFNEKRQRAVMIVCGQPPDVPLLYRWKHFDKAGAFGTRGSRVHGLYPKCLTLAITNMKTVPMVPDVSGELSIAQKQQRRLSYTTGFFELPESKIYLTKAMLYGEPLEKYMTRGLVVDKLKLDMVHMLQTTGPDDVATALNDLSMKVKEKTYHFIRGKYAQQCLG